MYRWNTGECTDGTRVMYKLLQKGGVRSSDNLTRAHYPKFRVSLTFHYLRDMP